MNAPESKLVRVGSRAATVTYAASAALGTEAWGYWINGRRYVDLRWTREDAIEAATAKLHQLSQGDS